MTDLSNANPNAQPQECDALHDLLPAFSLGATDPDETAWVKSHLAECPDALMELKAYAGLAEAMLYTAPPIRPPASLAEALRAASAQPARTSPAKPVAPETVRRGWERLWRWLATPRPAFTALALALLMLLSGFLGVEVVGLHSQQQELASRLERQTALLAAVGEGAYLRVTLPAGPAGQGSGAQATVICDPERSVGVVYAKRMPALPPGQAYQVWLIQGEQRTSAGLFQVSADGTGLLTFQAPLPMRRYDAMGITVEPATGSPQPTTPAVVKGPLYRQEY